MSRRDRQWTPSAGTVVVLAAAFALVGNLASSTVEVSWRWWPVVVWTAAGLLVVVSVIVEVVRHRSGTVHQSTRAHLVGHLGVGPTDVLDEAYRMVPHGTASAAVPPVDRGRLAQLPADTAAVTGRQAELSHLLAVIGDPASDSGQGGVVVICAVDGMGGIGKPNPGI